MERNIKDDDKLSDIKEKLVKNDSINSTNTINNSIIYNINHNINNNSNNKGFSREKALNFIKYGSKALEDNFESENIDGDNIEKKNDQNNDNKEDNEENGDQKNKEGKENEEDEENKEDKEEKEDKEDKEERQDKENGENIEDKESVENKKDNEDNSKDLEASPPKKKTLNNSKSYKTLRENYSEIQNRIIELAQLYMDRKKNELSNNHRYRNNSKTSESKNESTEYLDEAKEEQIKTNLLFETEDIIQEIPLNDNIKIRDYKKYYETISTPLDAINETNNKYHHLESNIKNATEKLELLISSEGNILNNQSSVTDERRSSIKGDLLIQPSPSRRQSNSHILGGISKSNISPFRERRRSSIISEDKLTQVDESPSVSKSSIEYIRKGSLGSKSKFNRRKSENMNNTIHTISSKKSKIIGIGNNSGSTNKLKSYNKSKRSSKSKLRSSSSSRNSFGFRSRSRSHSRATTKSTIYNTESIINQGIEIFDYTDEEKVIENEFSYLKKELVDGIGEFEDSLNEFVEWKNEIFKNNIPSNMKLDITLLFSRLFRSKNILLTPLFETLRKIDIYSSKWVNNDRSISKIEEDYLKQENLINMAIKMMLQLNFQITQLKAKRASENWANLIEKFIKKYKLFKYRNYKDSLNNDDKKIISKFSEKERQYYMKKIQYLKDKIEKYKKKNGSNEEKSEDSEKKEDRNKSKKKQILKKSKLNGESNQISEDLYIRILEYERKKLNMKNALFNRTLLKKKPRWNWNAKKKTATNIVRYKYLVQKNFRALPYLIQNLKDYVAKGFWRGPKLLRNHYISEYFNEIYTRSYYKKDTSLDKMKKHNSCTNLKELLKLSTKKVNPYLVRSNSFSCGQEFPWINSRSINENYFKEENEKRIKQKREEFYLYNTNYLIDNPLNDLDNYINKHVAKENSLLINQENLAYLSNEQICDIITILYPDTESIVKIYNEEQPKFYIGSEDEDDDEEMEDKNNDQLIQEEIKKSTKSTKLLNAVINSNSNSKSNSNEIDDIDWKDDILQEDIIYDQIKNNINCSDDYVPWRCEIEELYFNPYNHNKNQYEKDLKAKVHEFLNNYNSNIVNGLSYKNRFDVKANIAHKIKGEQGDIDEGIIGSGLGVDFENKMEELIEYFDPEKTWFSLQDVMELTLLHAQQMELLNDEFIKRIKDLNQKIIEAEKKQRKPEEINDEKLKYKNKITELNDIIRKQTSRIDKLQKENESLREILENVEEEEEEEEEKKEEEEPIVNESQEQPEEKITNEPIKKRKFSHKITKHSFLNRIEVYNIDKIKHLNQLIQEEIEKNLKAYEFTLSSEKPMDISEEEYKKLLKEWIKSGQKLKAEFMPINPGLKRPEYYTELKLHGFKTPWENKLNITPKKPNINKPLDIVNLFEIVRKIKLMKKPVEPNSNNKKSFIHRRRKQEKYYF